MIRVSNRGYFLTENYMVINNGRPSGLVSGGGRWFIKRLALDYGVFIPMIDGYNGFIAFPWLGFSTPIDKK
ncbi:MAG: hypothetical protein KDC53_13475 [Saprospiraceae bacterium]|nr:hypothetical protein [Saprospiraceae bacterium]